VGKTNRTCYDTTFRLTIAGRIAIRGLLRQLLTRGLTREAQRSGMSLLREAELKTGCSGDRRRLHWIRESPG
jgi:hypothetical protein